jgi:hypothetical protein
MTEHEIEIAIARALQGGRGQPNSPRHRATSMMEAAAPERASRVALLAEVEDLRLLFQDLRFALASPDAKTTRITGKWHALDVVAHLASWAAETRREMERLLARTPFDYTIHFEAEGGPRAWNQREVDDRAELGLSELVDELNVETERLAELVLNAPGPMLDEVVELPRTSGEPPQRWRIPLGAMVLASCWHARLHLRQLIPRRI